VTSIDKLVKHHQRDDLAGEHRLGDAGQLIIFIVFLAIWILDGFFLNYTTFLDKYVPLAAQVTVGTILLLVAVVLARSGLNTVFGKVRKTPGVIREGIFGIVRHPIYLSEILFYLGLVVFRISLAALAIWFIAVLFLHYLSRYEERLLLERFGDDYRRYMKEVPMYFPRIMRRKEKA
jgi:protein-S-isoprenylcysteine O-methyltransferase Ste14